MELIRMSAEQDVIAALAARFEAGIARIEAKLTAPAAEPVDLSPLAAVADKMDALAPVLTPTPAQAPVEGSAAEESAETPAQAASEADAVPVPAAQPAAEQPAPAAVPAAPVPFPSVPLA